MLLKLKIPPPGHMLIFAVGMWLLHIYLPITYVIPAPWNKAGIVAIAGAFLLDVSSLLLFFKRKTSPNPFVPAKATHLVTSGMYRFTRNPMYLGLAILLTGWATYLGSLSPFLLVPLFVVLLTYLQIIPEEQILENKFGQAYRSYKNTVRRWL